MRRIAAIFAWELTAAFYYWAGIICGALGLFLAIGGVLGGATGTGWSLFGLASAAIGHLYFLDKLEIWARTSHANRAASTTLLGSATVICSLLLSVPWLLSVRVHG